MIASAIGTGHGAGGLPPMHGLDPADCVFCHIIAARVDPGVCLPVTADFVVFPARHQRLRNRGHMLLVPARHHTTLADVPPAHAIGLLSALTTVTKAVREAFNATGVTVRMNLGHPGQSVAHLHLHVIPRQPGDDFTTSTSQPAELADRLEQTQLVDAALLRGDSTERREERL